MTRHHIAAPARTGMLALLAAVLTVVTVMFAPAGPSTVRAQSGTVPPELQTPYEVLGGYPHDPQAFLQGWVWHDGGFYESTGLYGESSLRRVAFPSGEVLEQVPVSNEYFAEGLAMVDDRLVQLTWRAKKGFVYDRESFALIGDFAYETEGWGLTYDGASLILSDGSDRLFFLDPATYQPVRSVNVTLAGRPLRRLNELEWIRGEVWANVWQTDMIVRIDPASGQVLGVLDMTGLLQEDPRRDDDDVLNGIAYDESTDRIFVSGKRWPLLFEIRVPQ
ncbi:MAG: glutaminyl-peptide cyclotransferase [Chloroflexota bacterium]